MIVYNEIEPYAAEWLRNLATHNHIAGPATIDTRSIADLGANDVRHATQFHAFAGIGVWSYALRLAGWPDDAPVWTGSCPCQPFSVAGRRKGKDDDRHLFPVWRDLIAECLPPVVFGEQVASPDGRDWLDNVLEDLEQMGYVCGASDMCAAHVGAPHIRQRLFFGGIHENAPAREAERATEGPKQQSLFDEEEGVETRLRSRSGCDSGNYSQVEVSARPGRLGDSDGGRTRRDGRGSTSPQGRDAGPRNPAGSECDAASAPGAASGMADTDDTGRKGVGVLWSEGGGDREVPVEAPWRGATRGAWGAADWVYCRDGKWRPVEPGTQPLADGSAYGVVKLRTGEDVNVRKGMLKAYGNAIVPQVAATFIRAFMDAIIQEAR